MLQKFPGHQRRAHLIGMDTVPCDVAGMADLAIIFVQLLEVYEDTSMLFRQLADKLGDLVANGCDLCFKFLCRNA